MPYPEQVHTLVAESESLPVLRRRLLDWYVRNRRDLPWRETSDPYAVWISEIMLQQTRVAAVVERYLAFLKRFPTVHKLAGAREEDVLALWSGLGYYRRARMLHKAAQQVVSQHGGALPRTAKELQALPGIGTYTAAAIASIAYGEHVAVVDGNVERVLCRLHGWGGGEESKGAIRKQVEKLAAQLVSRKRPGDFNQAVMELGATVCAPRNPQCQECPVAHYCKTRGEHKKAPRKPMSNLEIGHALVLRTLRKGPRRGNVEVLLEQRPDHLTVMPGLWELPALRNAEVPEAELRLTVKHAVMQVNYFVRVWNLAEKDLDRLADMRGDRRWVNITQLSVIPLTGLTRKILKRTRMLE